MILIIAKIITPIITIFIAITGVLQGIDYIKGKLKKVNQTESNEPDEFV